MATSEQIDADQALLEAIDCQHREVYEEEPPGVVTKYLLIAQRQWVEDGEFRSHIYATTADEMSLADTLGLIEFAGAQFRKLITDE